MQREISLFCVTVLVHPGRPDADHPEGARARGAALDALFEQREAECERVTAELDTCKVSYRHQGGILHELSPIVVPWHTPEICTVSAGEGAQRTFR